MSVSPSPAAFNGFAFKSFPLSWMLLLNSYSVWEEVKWTHFAVHFSDANKYLVCKFKVLQSSFSRIKGLLGSGCGGSKFSPCKENVSSQADERATVDVFTPFGGVPVHV